MSRNTEERLIHMANHIATNLALDDAPAHTMADHITAFWSPRMKQQIFAYIAEMGSDSLSPVANEALALLASKQS